MLVCAFLCTHCTRDRGCSAHPAFPAPSFLSRDKVHANLGLFEPRECGVIFCIATISIPRRPGQASVASAISDVQLHIGGPIRRGGCCLAMMVDGFPSTIDDGGCGS